MNRKYLFTAVLMAALLLTGLAAQAAGSRAVAQEGQPEAPAAPAADVASSFTYQGYVQKNNVAIEGSCDFEFRLYNAAGGGSQVGALQGRNGLAVNQGRFSTELDFGGNAFDGQGRWLEIRVRCPAGTGQYATLDPRQSLTAAPYALSLRPGAGVTGNTSAGILNLTNSGNGSGLTVSSPGGNGVNVPSAGTGVKVSSAGTGVYVENATGTGLFVEAASDTGVRVVSAPVGVRVHSGTNQGLLVNSAGEGVRVLSATGTGVGVDSAANGFGVGTATGSGLFINSAGGNGVGVGTADIGFKVDVANTGVRVGSTTNDGLFVNQAGRAGLWVESATNNGVLVSTTGADGFGVASAARDGLWVGQTNDDGIQLGNGTVTPKFGLFTPSPGTTNTALLVETANGNGEWALLTTDKIRASNVTVNSQTLLAMVADGASLEAGDVVSAAGLAPALPNQHGRLSLVRQSSGEELAGIVGVVEGRMELLPAPGKEGVFELHSVAGAAKPGDLVAITVLGAAQVKVAAQAAIQPGQRLTAGQQPGTARAMQSRQIEGMTVDEGGPSLGVALEPAENGLIWVLVNPQ